MGIAIAFAVVVWLGRFWWVTVKLSELLVANNVVLRKIERQRDAWAWRRDESALADMQALDLTAACLMDENRNLLEQTRGLVWFIWPRVPVRARDLRPPMVLIAFLLACSSPGAGLDAGDAAQFECRWCEGGIAALHEDAGDVDAAPVDAMAMDAGDVDAAPVDAMAMDAGDVDAAPVDAMAMDAGDVDAAPVDARSHPSGDVCAPSSIAGGVCASLPECESACMMRAAPGLTGCCGDALLAGASFLCWCAR